MGRAPSRSAEEFASAVHAEIRAEMARQQMSATDLTELVPRGRQYISDRMRDLLPFDLNDLSDVAIALGLAPNELVVRAEQKMRAPDNVYPIRPDLSDVDLTVEPSAANRVKSDHGENEDDPESP